MALLPQPQRLALLALGRAVSLSPGQVLQEPGEPLQHLYFPERGSVVLMMPAPEHPGLEVGLVGAEGMLGLHRVLGVATAPWRAQVQSPGTAWQLPQEPVAQLLTQAPELRRVLARYLSVRLVQLSIAAACLRYHRIGPRLARWLLMSHDRAGTDHFDLTHEDLARVLGVRRVGITEAAGRLQQAGLIHYHRGSLSVVNRPGLQAAACSCYGADQASYAAQLGVA